MSAVLEWIVIVSVLALGITYCLMVSFFIRCFSEMFYSVLDLNDEWQKKIIRNKMGRTKAETKKSQKKTESTINTVRGADGKSYFSC